MGAEIPAGDNEVSEQALKKTGYGISMASAEKTPTAVPAESNRIFVLTGVVSLIAVIVIFVGVLVLVGIFPAEKDQRDSIESKQEYLTIVNGPFNVTLPLFSEKITLGYESHKDFKADFKEMAKMILNEAIGQNYSIDDVEQDGAHFGDAVPEVGIATDNEDSGGKESLISSADAYETNNQEFTIDRADFVKSNGNFLFAAFSDHLVVLKTDSRGVVFKVKMTPLSIATTNGCPGCFEPTLMAVEGDAAVQQETWKPTPRIEALLIHGNRLTAIVSGYGLEHAEKLGRIATIYEYLSTRIQVYEIGVTGDLQLISQQDVNGNFMNAYSDGDFVHVVTRSSINTWNKLLEPIDRNQLAFQGMDDALYHQMVTKLVDEGLLDRFVEDLINEVQVSGPVDLARLSFFTDSIAADNADKDLYQSGITTSISQVVSFDMSAVSGSTTGVGTIQPHMAATFHPGSWGQVYAVGSMIVVADVGWSWIPDENRSSDTTFLVCFNLSGASSTHALVGTVKGTLLSPFSLDYVEKTNGNYLRVATTQNFWTPLIDKDGDGGAVISLDAPDQVVMSAAAAEPEPLTLNQIIVLKVPSESTASLVSVGSVELGEPTEVFTAVRFFDDFAYAVIFGQTAPYYVVDLSGEEPIVSGELKVSGFSEYLHPIDSNDKMLLSIGHDANETGIILGYQISLFDASDASNPTLMNRLVIENDENSWSSSSASMDERAFRFLSLGEAKGKVIIPLSRYKFQEFDESGQLLSSPISENFEGFSIFNVENGQITKDFDIDHGLEIPYDESCGHSFECFQNVHLCLTARS